MHLQTKSLPSSLKRVTDCHKACFPGSFSVKLGDPYLIKSFEWFLSGDNRFLFYAEDEHGNVTGYCGAFISKQPGDGSTSGMMQYAMQQAAFGIAKKPALLFNEELQPFYPLIIKNIYKKFFSRKKKSAPDLMPLANFEKKTGLVVIGVHPDHRGKGVFEMLMKNLEKESLQRNIYKLTLSVKSTNLRAINAYKKVGWQIADYNAKATLMYKILAANAE